MKNKKKKKSKKQPRLNDGHLKFDAELLKNEVWLTTQEVLKHLKISRSTLFRMRLVYNIPSIKLGRSPMYPKYLLNKILLMRAYNNLKSSDEE